MKSISEIIGERRKIKNQKYYLTNFHGDIIASNLSRKEAESFIKNYEKEKLYIQEELNFS